LGLFFSAATLLAIACAYWPKSPRQVVPPLAAPLALASSSTLAGWATAGLEQPLLALGLAVALALTVNDLDTGRMAPARCHLLGLALALMAWTRPDGALLAGTLLLPWALLRPAARNRMRQAAIAALWPTAAVVAQLLFRAVYYHDFVPSSARAKVALTATRLSGGVDYVHRGAVAHMALLTAAIAALVLVASAAVRSRRLVLIVVPCVAWTTYFSLAATFFPPPPTARWRPSSSMRVAPAHGSVRRNRCPS
jgi:hypothetical protein